MADGTYPPTIRLKPCPALLAAILIIHLAGALALLFMQLPLAATFPLVLLVGLSAIQATRAQTHKRGLSFVLAKDGALRLYRENTDFDVWTRVLPNAVLFPSAAWFALTWGTGRRQTLRLMLFPAEIVEEERGGNKQWRRLRVWLRHCALNAPR
ncbi:MAG: hypothetical protein LBG78_07005 [Azoarcus sp.]|jgi:hypothetical protein|nr:hypothetical protein [Azoarcus sp.]